MLQQPTALQATHFLYTYALDALYAKQVVNCPSNEDDDEPAYFDEVDDDIPLDLDDIYDQMQAIDDELEQAFDNFLKFMERA